MDVRHKKKHDLDDTNDHVGPSGAVVDEIMKFDANGLPAISEMKHFKVLRNVPATGLDYVEIGFLTQAQGSFALLIAVSSEDVSAARSGTDLYYIVAKYDETAAAWELAYPLQTIESHSQICVMVDDDDLHLRLIAITSTPGTVPTNVQIIELGVGDVTFTAASGTGTMALPTQEFASTLISQVGGRIQLHAETNLNSEKITELGDGSAGTQDGCSVKQMEDHVMAAIGDKVGKDPVHAATTVALPANTRTADVLTADAVGAFPTIDGVAPVINQYYLVKNEGGGTSHINNGIYELTVLGDVGTAWELTRRHDMEGGEGASGAAVPVTEGTANADTTFKCFNNIGSDVINTDALEFRYWGETTDHANLKNKAWSAAGHTFDTFIDIDEIAAPVKPAADKLRLYVEDFKGFSFFNFLDSTGMNRKLIRDSVFVVKADVDLTVGEAVYTTGSSGNVPTVDKAKADAIGTMPAIGIMVESILAGAYGRCMQVGLLENFNTDAFLEGDAIFVSEATAGALTKTAPVYPNIRQEIGSILVKGVGNGAMQVLSRSMQNDGFTDHEGLLNKRFSGAYAIHMRPNVTLAGTIPVYADLTGAGWDDGDRGIGIGTGGRVFLMGRVGVTVVYAELSATDKQTISISWATDRDIDLVVDTGLHRIPITDDGTLVIRKIRAMIGTAPTGADIILDVHKNGTTIFTTQGNRPTIAIGAFDSGEVSNMDVTTLTKGDYLTLDIDQIGSVIPGKNMVVRLDYGVTP